MLTRTKLIHRPLIFAVICRAKFQKNHFVMDKFIIQLVKNRFIKALLVKM